MKRLVLDIADWTEAGELLLEKDPTRFAAILELVRDINIIQRDPLAKAPGKREAALIMSAGKRGVS